MTLDGAERAGAGVIGFRVPPFKEISRAGRRSGGPGNACRSEDALGDAGRPADDQERMNSPDAVVIAIGGIPIRLEIPGADGPNVITVEEGY